MKKYILFVVSIFSLNIYFSQVFSDTFNCLINATNNKQTFIVPCGVSKVTINAVGGSGGPSPYCGLAARMIGTFAVKKGDVLYSVIVKTSTFLKRCSGLSFCFSKNAAVLLNKQFKPIATRVFGVIPSELRNKKFTKIISLSSGLL